MEYLNQNDDGSFRHFTFKVRLSGDTALAREYLKAAEADLFALKREMRIWGTEQQYRHLSPVPGVTVKLSIVGMIRVIEIYAKPSGKEKEEEEHRPCFCNCCFAECQIVKVDGTWRSSNHPDVPLPDLGYKHGDRRLRYDVDVCSFVGKDPVSGLTVHEFYRVENVMPSDFTPYKVGDWAMVYFTDEARGEKCGECEDCLPEEKDQLGVIDGCGPRDVMIWMNLPQCVILPIAINDRMSRGTVMFRSIEEMRAGVCVKKANIDWVQFYFQEDPSKPEPQPGERPYICLPGSANITWTAWTEAYPATIIHNVPIHYCTQDGTNQHGSHAFRPKDWVYVLLEGDVFTIVGRTVETLWGYDQYQNLDVKTPTPALLILRLNADGKGSSGVPWGPLYQGWWSYYYSDADESPSVGESAPPIVEQLVYLWDLTHDKALDFTQSAWCDENVTGWQGSDVVYQYLNAYLNRGISPTASYNWGAPLSGTQFPDVITITHYGKVWGHYGDDGMGGPRMTVANFGLNFDHVFVAGYDDNHVAQTVSHLGGWADGTLPAGVMRIRWPSQSSLTFMMARYRASPYSFRRSQTYDGYNDSGSLTSNCRSDYDVKVNLGEGAQWDNNTLVVDLTGFPNSSITFPAMMATVTRHDVTSVSGYTVDNHPVSFYVDATVSMSANTTVTYKFPDLSFGATDDEWIVVQPCNFVHSVSSDERTTYAYNGYNWDLTNFKWDGYQDRRAKGCTMGAMGGVFGISSLSCRFTTATWETQDSTFDDIEGHIDQGSIPPYPPCYPFGSLDYRMGDIPYGVYSVYAEADGTYPTLKYDSILFDKEMNCCTGAAWMHWTGGSELVESYNPEGNSSYGVATVPYLYLNKKVTVYYLRDKTPLYQSRSGIKRAFQFEFVELISRLRDPMRTVNSPPVEGVNGGALREIVFPQLDQFLERMALGFSGPPVLHQEYLDGWFEMTIDHTRMLTREINVNGYYIPRRAVRYTELIDAQYQVSGNIY